MSSEKYKITRLKLDNLSEGEHKITLYKHFNSSVQELCTKIVKVRKFCVLKSLYLKFLDNDGKYKFITLDKYNIVNYYSEEKGKLSRLVTNLETGKNTQQSIGYNQTKIINASISNVTKNEFDNIKGVVNSTKVYLQINENNVPVNDDENNWILVKVNGDMNYNSKNPSQIYNLEIELPTQYTISL